MANEVRRDRDRIFAGFGITYLDNMLGRRDKCEQRGDPMGLPIDAPAALIGEDGTYKSVLGRAFLAQCFRKPPRDNTSPRTRGVAVLLTTKDIDRENLRTRLGYHLNMPNTEVPSEIPETHVICRRLELHHLTSPILLHIVKRLVEKAQLALFRDDMLLTTAVKTNGDGRMSDVDVNDFAERKAILRDEYLKVRVANGWHIRCVIDNWRSICDAYPEIHDDPIALPSILFYLRRESIATLVTSTESGGPPSIRHPVTDSLLRKLTAHQLYTWHVPFFGVDRVAITVIPPVTADRYARVREVKSRAATRAARRRRQLIEVKTGEETREESDPASEREQLLVNPELELYTGLKKGNPKLVPLKVHLYVDTGGIEHERKGSVPAADSALDPIEEFISEMKDLFGRIAVGNAKQNIKDVVEVTQGAAYERIREFSHLQSGTLLDYTLIFQVDEFWAESSVQLHEQWDYLHAGTVIAGKPNAVEDPFLLFQPTIRDGERQRVSTGNGATVPQSVRRFECFPTLRQSINEYGKNDWIIDKVPHLWDFGFLLIGNDAWTQSCEQVVDSSGRMVKDILSSLAMRSHSEGCATYVGWAEFLAACKAVADGQKDPSPDSKHAVPFDVSMIATETFSCLVLEMWASEIAESLQPGKTNVDDIFKKERYEPCGVGLVELLNEYDTELYRVWIMLFGSLKLKEFQVSGNAFRSRPALDTAVAARHWYSTATVASREAVETRLVPVGLPGSYSVRGDWFLAMAQGSRSHRMGERAMDLLSSRRGNIVRLQRGIGLPVRDVTDDGDENELWTPLLSMDRDTVRYAQLCELGAKQAYGIDITKGRSQFRWLWRSQIELYDRHARIWQRWLCYMLTQRSAIIDVDPKQWYDQYKVAKDNNSRQARFANECEKLVAILKRVSASGRSSA